MAFCTQCGAQVNEDARFCPTCGAAVKAPEATPVQPPVQEQPSAQSADFTQKLAGLNNTADTTGEFEQSDVANNKGMSVLAYLGLLWLIPFFAKKESKYTQYHCKQGFNLLLLEVAYTIISVILRALIKVPYYFLGTYIGNYTPGWLSTILWIVSIPLLVLAILGIVNAATGKAKELPIIGGYKILK